MIQNSNVLVNNSLHSIKDEAVLSDLCFENFRKYIYDNTGIYFQDNKKYLLESRLQKRLKYLGLDSFEKYLDYMKYNAGSQNEKKYLYEAITINETYFFRNQPQFDALISVILPEIIRKKQITGNPKIRIWSAASSSGEEAYSIAILVTELLKPRYKNLEVEIVGTDISTAVINTANSGTYREYSVRNTPAYYLRKYFKQNNNSYIIDPGVKEMVKFKTMNLHDDLSMRSMFGFDVIFCANVLIYFDLRSKLKVVSHLYNSLNRGGYLFIGYSETLHNISKSFKLVSFPKTIGYKKE